LTKRSIALETRIATAALALVIAAVSLPLVSGWILSDSHCCITTDICHPAQAVDAVHGPLLAPAPEAFSKASMARDAMLVIDHGYKALNDRPSESPDSPPPKAQA